MSVQGPASLPLRPFSPPALTGAGVPRGATAPGAPAAAVARKPEQAPAESSLWELLTDEERSFFSQEASLGALTYGRGRTSVAARPSNAAPTGQRLDVRG
jgi:hypothetical protein